MTENVPQFNIQPPSRQASYRTDSLPSNRNIPSSSSTTTQSYQQNQNSNPSINENSRIEVPLSDSRRRNSIDLQNNGKNELADGLLNKLSNSSSSNYRFINFKPKNSNLEDHNQKQYKKQVSFDNMNISYDDDDEPDSDDDVGWEIYKMKHGQNSSKKLPGYSRGRDLSPGPGRLSPMNSPRRNSSNYEESDRLDYAELRRFERQLVQYPTQPITTLRACSITRRHKLYEKLYNGELLPLVPVLPHRTILVYISARIHTWVALDWLLGSFIENGDKIIVCATVDPTIFQEKKKKRRRSYGSRSRSPSVYSDPLERYEERAQPENMVTIAKDLIQYIMQVINPEIIARVTVELVAGETKDVLKDMYRLYEPNLVCTGTKPNKNVGAPLRSWHSSKLTDRLVKNYPLPVIVVPSVNMCDYEISLQSKINQESIEKSKNSINRNNEGYDSDTDSIASSESSTSDTSATSYNSYDEIAHLYLNYKDDINKELTKLKKNPINEEYYADFAKAISDNSLNLCSDIIDVNPDFIGDGSKLARAITGSNSFGTSPYKTKSLLEPDEKKEQPKKEAPKEHKLSFKEVSEQLKLNKLKSNSGSTETSQSPKTIPNQGPDHDHDHSSPPPQTLKWGGLEKPNKEITNRQQNSSHPNHLALSKCLSDDIDTKHRNDSRTSLDRLKLEPRKSQPGMTGYSRDHSDNGEKKKKKKKFWKLW
ncbi:uncharacterized protein KGF55_002068 [Candida pseudojiufengensis]|uniref:uncharacterized protein n=1 Tax=Candida pseudojiufengensis TaxID=497109 RepID=UPI002224D4CA|nr:uncharacterized protein KGF55_002068 [Candida pseudojiufengensis]KAI5964126.1 hypothetical protein KGF55_002068 [Candida pseudojiufengensis]